MEKVIISVNTQTFESEYSYRKMVGKTSIDFIINEIICDFVVQITTDGIIK